MLLPCFIYGTKWSFKWSWHVPTHVEMIKITQERLLHSKTSLLGLLKNDKEKQSQISLNLFKWALLAYKDKFMIHIDGCLSLDCTVKVFGFNFLGTVLSFWKNCWPAIWVASLLNKYYSKARTSTKKYHTFVFILGGPWLLVAVEAVFFTHRESEMSYFRGLWRGEFKPNLITYQEG
jgi:hypothetical protein